MRRFWLVKARPGYVRRSITFREGECRRCGRCCSIAFRCTYFEQTGCRIHGRHFTQCKAFPIDRRDTDLIARLGGQCGFSFNGRPPSGFFISRYGIRPIMVAAAVAVVLAVVASFVIGWYSLLFLALPAFVACFFRDPERLPADSAPEAVLAPADGKVVSVTRGVMPEGEGDAHVVDIFLSILNVHVNRAPAAGKVSAVSYRKGAFLNALRERAGEANESNTVWIETDGGGTVAVRQIAGAIARRIVCTVAPGARMCAGERFGMIKFGSRTQLFVPVESGFEPAVKPGEKVRAGETVVGHFR